MQRQDGGDLLCELPEPYTRRGRIYVRELARIVAEYSYCSMDAARSRVYRMINRGRIQATEVSGIKMVSAAESLRLLNGDFDD